MLAAGETGGRSQAEQGRGVCCDVDEESSCWRAMGGLRGTARFRLAVST